MPTSGSSKRINAPRFLAEIDLTTRKHGSRLTHFYVMLDEDGVVTAKWEAGPNNELTVSYRVTNFLGKRQCPHCVVHAAIDVIAKALTLDARRVRNAHDGYELTLRQGKRPCAAFGRGPMTVEEIEGIDLDPEQAAFMRMMVAVTPQRPGWQADTHAADGNPHTLWDCSVHRKK